MKDWERFEKEMETLRYSFPSKQNLSQIDKAINDISETISQKLEFNSLLYTPLDRKNDLPAFIQKHIKKKR